MADGGDAGGVPGNGARGPSAAAVGSQVYGVLGFLEEQYWEWLRFEWLPSVLASGADRPVIRNECLALDLVAAWVNWFLGSKPLPSHWVHDSVEHTVSSGSCAGSPNHPTAALFGSERAATPAPAPGALGTHCEKSDERATQSESGSQHAEPWKPFPPHCIQCVFLRWRARGCSGQCQAWVVWRATVRAHKQSGAHCE